MELSIRQGKPLAVDPLVIEQAMQIRFGPVHVVGADGVNQLDLPRGRGGEVAQPLFNIRRLPDFVVRVPVELGGQGHDVDPSGPGRHVAHRTVLDVLSYVDGELIGAPVFALQGQALLAVSLVALAFQLPYLVAMLSAVFSGVLAFALSDALLVFPGVALPVFPRSPGVSRVKGGGDLFADKRLACVAVSLAGASGHDRAAPFAWSGLESGHGWPHKRCRPFGSAGCCLGKPGRRGDMNHKPRTPILPRRFQYSTRCKRGPRNGCGAPLPALEKATVTP